MYDRRMESLHDLNAKNINHMPDLKSVYSYNALEILPLFVYYGVLCFRHEVLST